MSKTRIANQRKKAAAPAKDQAPSVVPAPWVVRCDARQAMIDAYVAATDEWETIATVPVQAGVDADRAEAVADFIVRLANDSENTDLALRSALTAIEELLACAGKPLSYDAEQEAEIAEEKIRKLLAKNPSAT